jgi:hypothetical protein
MLTLTNPHTSCGCGCTTDNPRPETNESCSTSRPANNIAPTLSTKKQLLIELLYLDLSTCDPCQGAEASLEEALAEVSQVLQATNIEVTTRKTHIESLKQVEALRFVSSPTIRIDGKDIQLTVQESRCDSCSALAGTDVDCRSWEYQGQTYSRPPKAMVMEAVLRAVYGEGSGKEEMPQKPYVVSDNIRRFFAAKHEG